jgi:hypothetical protein
MYFIVGILICIFIFGIILLNLVKIILKQKEQPYKKILNIALYIVAIATLLNIILAGASFFKTKDKVAMVGDRGMKGPKGTKGKKAICDTKCGQKVCYVRVYEHLNNYFSKRMNKLKNQSQSEGPTQMSNEIYEIVNEEFKDIINKICSSDKYTNILSQKLKKKPNEDKLIKYLENTIEQWIDLFFEYNPDNATNPEDFLGVKYLTSKYLTFDDINNEDGKFENTSMQNPINIIANYDIYSWAGNNDTTKLKLEIKSQNVIMPQTNEPKLFILKSNNYKKIYDTKMRKSIWDTTYCLYNQMGEDATNPNNVRRCVYLNQNSNLKEYKGAWKKESFQEPDPLSIYNPEIFKDNKNQLFYPVGSVWTATKDVKKKSYKKRLPKSRNYCGDGHGGDKTIKHHEDGPEKETILVSGDVVDPEKYVLLWDSKKGCMGCQENENAVKIYRPIAPKGYVALGDVAVKYNENVEDLKIKCIPEYCLKKMSLGPMVWNNQDLEYLKFNSYTNYTKKKPYFFKKQVSCTLWSAGASNIFEENRNNYNFDLDDDGGYNLFRIVSGKGFKKSPEDMYSYKIINKYLLPAEGIKPKNLELKINDNSNPNEQLYKHDIFFGSKPESAIITNKETMDSFNNTLYDSGPTQQINVNNISIQGYNSEPNRIYLINDGNKRKENQNDSYFLKTYSKKKKDYSACIICSENGKIRISDICDKTNDFHIWNVMHDENTNDVNTANINLRPKAEFLNSDDSSSPRCLRHYYDSMGKGHYELTLCPEKITNPTSEDIKNHYRFKYDTIVANKMPQYFD